MTVDREELERRVQDGQRAQRVLSDLTAIDAVVDDIEKLRTTIAALEAAGNFHEVLPHKVELARLVSARRGTP